MSDDTWQEETVTWNNAPVADTTLLASLGQVSANTWYEVDLTTLITGDGTYNLRISDSTGGADYSSKEGTNAPKLLIALAGATPQSCGTRQSASIQMEYRILSLHKQSAILGIMGNKLCPKVILEGTRLTFKTEIAFELNEHPRIVGPRKYRYHSPLISAEWCTFTNYPWGRGPINFEPHDESLAIEVYSTWARMFELQKYYSWIVDRFHISTQAYQKQTYNKDYGFRWLEERLLPLNFRIVFCNRSPESFEAARAERLKVSGNPSQYNDLSPFIREQELLRELVAKSMLPSLTLDISDNNISAAIERIADWMEQSGGLYMPD